jgi:hypothetical protein
VLNVYYWFFFIFAINDFRLGMAILKRIVGIYVGGMSEAEEMAFLRSFASFRQAENSLKAATKRGMTALAKRGV